MPRLPPPEGEERGMSDSKSARRYDDAAVELGVPIRKERADNPPAPPPCEDCKGIPNPAAMLNFDALDLVVAHHARLRAKDAEIAELRAERDEAHDFIRRWLAAPYFDEKRDWRVWAKGMRKRAEAALAPPKKEGL